MSKGWRCLGGLPFLPFVLLLSHCTAVYLHKYKHKCVSHESVSKVRPYILHRYDQAASVQNNCTVVLYRDGRLRFVGSPSLILSIFCWGSLALSLPCSDLVRAIMSLLSTIFSCSSQVYQKENHRDGDQMKDCMFPGPMHSS